jgi:ribosomal protein S18 acetylase RimI-like enzyme
MKVKLRHTKPEDLEQVYELHERCFNKNDLWYRPNIRPFLDNGYVVECDTKIIAVLLQGPITPCNKNMECYNNEYEDIFEPVNETGKIFVENNIIYKELYGIVMICVDSNFRGKGLGRKLIQKHFDDNPNKLLCLNTRRSNINAYNLYKKMNYEHIAFIKNKYFLPNEDSVFMIKN